jgi:hypothetical protein
MAKPTTRASAATRQAPPREDNERCMVWNLNVEATLVNYEEVTKGC